MENGKPEEFRIETEPYEEIVGRLDYSTLRASSSGSPVCNRDEEEPNPTTLDAPILRTSESQVSEINHWCTRFCSMA